MRKRYVLTALVTVVLLGLFAFSAASEAAEKAKKASQGKGIPAMDAAAKSDKYLFVFFWKNNDEQSRAMGKIFTSTIDKMKDRANRVSVRANDPIEKPFVDKFGVARAPMPLVVAVAPNGAVTKGLPLKFTGKDLEEAFASPCVEKCLKAIQDQKLVVLCVQNEQTPHAEAAMKAARAFKADERFAKATEIITLDPADKAESAMLSDLEIGSKLTDAVTVVLAPPGAPVARFTGAVTKDQIAEKVTASGACADGNCGPGGCCPK